MSPLKWLGCQTEMVIWLAIPALVLGVGGCARPAGKGMVSGRVILDGKPVPGGEIVFRSTGPNSFPVVAKIDENGNYAAVELPAGDVMVIVDNRKLAPAAPPGPKPIPKGLSAEARAQIIAQRASHPPPPSPPPPKPDGKYVPLPARYVNGEAEDELKFTVQTGPQSHDIELKSK
jgi:hypothetical protein